MKFFPLIVLIGFVAGCGGDKSPPDVKQKTADNPIANSTKEMAKDHEGPAKK